MKNALILHGTGNNSQGNWFQWLKKQLEKRGYEVWVPDLPDANLPSAEKYNQLLLNHGFDFNKETILVGHSSGASSIFNILQELPESAKVGSAYLVGVFKEAMNSPARSRLFPKPVDVQKVKAHCDKFVFIHSDNDPYCPLADARYLSKELGGELVVEKGQGHFNLEASPSYKEFPLLIELIDKENSKPA